MLPIEDKKQCPECLKWVYEEELDMFGGVCEECHFEMNKED